jgi:hypothetical protein
MNIIKEYKYLMIFVGLISIIQLLLTPITYDEAYYWVYSNFLSFGYYDHPPMVALLIAIGEVFWTWRILYKNMFFVHGNGHNLSN